MHTLTHLLTHSHTHTHTGVQQGQQGVHVTIGFQDEGTTGVGGGSQNWAEKAVLGTSHSAPSSHKPGGGVDCQNNPAQQQHQQASGSRSPYLPHNASNQRYVRVWVWVCLCLCVLLFVFGQEARAPTCRTMRVIKGTCACECECECVCECVCVIVCVWSGSRSP